MRFAIAALLLVACKPEITANTYFCGPDGLCPPDLRCDRSSSEEFAFNCVSRAEANAFACEERTTDFEPDDNPSDAFKLGELQCGAQIVFDTWGCVESSADVDHFHFVMPSQCVGSNPRVSIRVSFPLGAAPIAGELRTLAGETLATSELCTIEGNQGGIERICIDASDLPVGEYLVALHLDDNANADCEGSCAHNRYQLSLVAPTN